MQSSRRLHSVAAFALFVACPLLSAVVLAGIGIGLGAAFGAEHIAVVGAEIAAAVFVVNAGALCMAIARRAGDEQVFAFDVNATEVVAPAKTRASSF